MFILSFIWRPPGSSLASTNVPFHHSILGLELGWKAQLDCADGVSLEPRGTMVTEERLFLTGFLWATLDDSPLWSLVFCLRLWPELVS